MAKCWKKSGGSFNTSPNSTTSTPQYEILENDIHSIASKGIVTTEEIERMLKDASEELSDSKPLNLKRLGIDEIALIKGKGNYCAVLVDIDTSKLIAILGDRTQTIIRETLL